MPQNVNGLSCICSGTLSIVLVSAESYCDDYSVPRGLRYHNPDAWNLSVILLIIRLLISQADTSVSTTAFLAHYRTPVLSLFKAGRSIKFTLPKSVPGESSRSVLKGVHTHS